jgi:glycosyltransferase involved in cell wall biosynthesis
VIHVVHVVVAGEVGGAERMLVDLASSGETPAIRHSVAVLSPDDRVARLFRSASLRVVERRSREGPLPFLWQSLGRSAVRWLVEALSREQATVVHLHTFASQVVGTRAALALGLPTVRTEHSTRAFVDPTCWPFARWSLARASASVSVSRHVRDVALARAPWAASRARVIPNGVDVTRFAPGPELPDGPLRVAVVGRLEPRKGVDRAIEAAARLPSLRLDVLGDGGLRASLEEHARRLGATDRVRFLGFVDDVRPALARCHALLCTSRSEGLGVALLEGMAMGRPVVGFRVGGAGEIVDDELGSLLTAPDDVAALVALLRQAAEEPGMLRALGPRARARVVERFSAAAMRDAYARTYEEALAGATLRAS